MSHAIHAAAAKNLREAYKEDQKEDFVAAHAHATPLSLLSLPLSIRANRISRAVFICWYRFELRLPQLERIGNLRYVEKLGYGAERCVGDCRNQPFLDLHATHANLAKCKSTAAGRHFRHTLLKWAINYLAGLAGCRAVIEPPTNRVLLEEYSPQQCRGLFLHHPSKKERQAAEKLHAEFTQIFKLPPEERVEKTKDANARLQAILNSRKKKKGLRLDLWITDPSTGDEAFIDMACTHPNSKSHLAAEVKRTKERLATSDKSIRKLPGAAVEKMEKAKTSTYALLHSIALKQASDGMRPSEPELFGAIVSTHGEFSPGMLKLQEWLTCKYAARVRREGDRDDGIDEDVLIGRFRNKIRGDVLRAMVSGHAAMMLAAGLPMGGARLRCSNANAKGSDPKNSDSDSDSDSNSNLDSDK